MFDRAAVEARLEKSCKYSTPNLDDHYLCSCLHEDFRATLTALDAATARVAALEAQVRVDHADGGGCCTRCCGCDDDCFMGKHLPYPCAVLTTLALAPAPGEENG